MREDLTVSAGTNSTAVRPAVLPRRRLAGPWAFKAYVVDGGTRLGRWDSGACTPRSRPDTACRPDTINGAPTVRDVHSYTRMYTHVRKPTTRGRLDRIRAEKPDHFFVSAGSVGQFLTGVCACTGMRRAVL